MTPLSNIFNIKYGHSLELNKLEIVDESEGIPFISRKQGDNGIAAYVKQIPNVKPANPKSITCALSGSVLSTFLQDREYYTGYHIAILEPIQPLSDTQLLYYCTCIEKNKYRYSYGRQANRTLRDILVPDLKDIPTYVSDSKIETYSNSHNRELDIDITLSDTRTWKKFRFDEIFEIHKGYYNKKPPKSDSEDKIPFIGATAFNNGITGYISTENILKYAKDGTKSSSDIEKRIFQGQCITVSNNGSVGEAFYQKEPFTCTHDVNPLYLKNGKIITPELGIFLATLIKLEKYRWSYGRKWRPSRMPDSIIKLPVKEDSTPDWTYMETYIKTLPFSKQLNEDS